MRGPRFRNWLFLSALLLSFQIASPRLASAEKRVALVIGQSAYRAVPALPNAANDGSHIAEMLTGPGFDVTAAPDLAQNEMRQAISDFAGKVAGEGPDTVALVFYAGHGLQIDGENYLVPVDVDPKREADIPLQAVRLNDLMNTLGALPARMRIFMLDACRNNPFPALSLTAGHGLAIVNTKAGAPGSFISFSTSPGAEAEDGSGEDSPYTTAVLSIAKEPNLSIEEAFKRVRVAVNQATDGRQVPWESSSLTTDFRFFGETASTQAGSSQGKVAKPPAVTRTVDDWRRDLGGKDPKAAYELVVADDSLAAYEAFRVLFGESSYAPRVRSLIERRKQMLAWDVAVAANSAASYEMFLASYAGSDLAATARKLQLRVFNKTILAPTNVALGPICPCPTAPVQPLLKKVEPSPERPTKRVDKRKKGGGSDDPVVVERAPQGPPPGAILEGIGIGIGLGGMMHGGGGGMRGGAPTSGGKVYDR
jgi:uncharacterized caspase-like protein